MHAAAKVELNAVYDHLQLMSDEVQVFKSVKGFLLMYRVMNKNLREALVHVDMSVIGDISSHSFICKW